MTIPTALIVLCEPARAVTHGEKTRAAAVEWLTAHGFVVGLSQIIDHDAFQLNRAFAAVPGDARLIVTCGSTGIGERDIAPQTLERLCDFAVPGIGEVLRAGSLKFSLNSALSRCGAYVSRQRLVLSVPGSTKAATEQLELLKDLLPHAVEAASGKCADRRPPQ
jgi:molybdopterin biosynthesis enzyme MoaB